MSPIGQDRCSLGEIELRSVVLTSEFARIGLFSEDVLKEITREALSREVGARGLRAIFEDIMLDLMFEIPSKKDEVNKIVVDSEYLRNKKWIA